MKNRFSWGGQVTKAKTIFCFIDEWILNNGSTAADRPVGQRGAMVIVNKRQYQGSAPVTYGVSTLRGSQTYVAPIRDRDTLTIDVKH